MNCLIQSGPGETHILDTSVLYLHIKYTNRIQILSDNKTRVGPGFLGPTAKILGQLLCP